MTGRKMLGATKPADSAPGTIRGDYAVEVGRNICHGSDSVENAEKEVISITLVQLLLYQTSIYNYSYTHITLLL